MNLPVYDFHCDLTSYLDLYPGSTAMDAENIGCAIPHLQNGNVRFQVMAMFTMTQPGSRAALMRQAEIFRDLPQKHPRIFQHITSRSQLDALPDTGRMGIVPAIENASGLLEESDSITDLKKNLDAYIAVAGKPLYITITHHVENRFGGGNTTQIGLKPDGEALLRLLNGTQIAVDFSHTSDPLAADILAYIDQEQLDIPILASHSNFRTVCDNPRNLPDEIARKIVAKQGVIGINFVKDFVDPKDYRTLYQHIRYGLDLAGNSLVFGADFFPTETMREFMDPDDVFHDQLSNASVYPMILGELAMNISPVQVAGLAYQRAEAFLHLLLV